MKKRTLTYGIAVSFLDIIHLVHSLLRKKNHYRSILHSDQVILYLCLYLKLFIDITHRDLSLCCIYDAISHMLRNLIGRLSITTQTGFPQPLKNYTEKSKFFNNDNYLLHKCDNLVTSNFEVTIWETIIIQLLQKRIKLQFTII